MFSLTSIFKDIVTIEGEAQIAEAELATGEDVPIPALLTVGSIGGKPLYLVGTLTTTKPT